MALILTKEIKEVIQHQLRQGGQLEVLALRGFGPDYATVKEAREWIDEQVEGQIPLSVMHEGLRVAMDLFRKEEMEEDDE